MNNTNPIFYKIYKFILYPLFKLYYNPTIINKEYIPKEGPIVIAGNHKHLFDQCLTIGSTKRWLHYMAKKEYFDNKKVAWFFKSSGCISVDRQNGDKRAFNYALDILKENGSIGIFPEGTRNKTDKLLLDFKFGAVSLASKSDAYIVPFAITGDYCFRSKNLKIEYAKPFKVGNMNLEEANKKLTNEVKKILKKNLK